MKKFLFIIFFIFLFLGALYGSFRLSYDKDGYIRRYSLMYFLSLSDEIKFAPVYKLNGKIEYYHYSNEFGTYIKDVVTYCSKKEIDIEKYDKYFQKYKYRVERKEKSLDYAYYNNLIDGGDYKGDYKVGKAAWIKIENNCAKLTYIYYGEY